MSLYALTPRAQTDLEDIWNYTVAHWGDDQAEKYLRQIVAAMAYVAADPERGRACDEIRAGYRKCAVGVHVVFYRNAQKGVEIIRILHQRMDFQRHL
ncbi:MAG: type II toxin-antitoxin system RelE/ParE family toxin [Methylocystis sp.]|uniref:type II toxin-antitoxin system RelE/ParE family toxin n=1 Tax=Methylocystis sp. TaxID=1911079 RepID=UPI0039520D81